MSLDLDQLASLAVKLVGKHLLWSQDGRIFFSLKHLHITIAFLENDFEKLVPLIGSAFFVLRVRFGNQLETLVRSGEERREVVFKCLFIGFGKHFLELSEKSLCFRVVLFDFVLNYFFFLHSLLNFAVVTAIHENARPDDAVVILVRTLAVHQSVGPLTFVPSAVDVDHLAPALHLPLHPLPGVDCARGEMVLTCTVHLVLRPVTFIHFSPLVVGANKSHFAVTVLQLVAFKELPVADVQRLV